MSDDDAFCQSCGTAVALADDPVRLPAPVTEQASPLAGLTSPGWPQGNGIDSSPPPSTWAASTMAATMPAGVHITESPKTFEASFDPIDNPRFRAQLLQRAKLYAILWLVGGFLSFIPFLILGLVSNIAVGLILWAVAGLIIATVLFAAFLLLKIPIQLADWNVSIDGKGSASATAFEHMAYSLNRRQTPLDGLRVRRLNLPGAGQRDYLELQQGFFYGYVSCFAYGLDLYLGWTFWIQISPVSMFIMFIKRIWESITHKSSDLYTTLRYESARAMRDALHASTREGADVAGGALAPQGQGIIGSTIVVI